MKDEGRRAQAEAEALEPVIWLLGKTGAGKTSIVAELTASARDEVGNGFEPKTKSARIYPWPKERPILRFMDTKGLADVASYDGSHDTEIARASAHIIMAVVRADDMAIEEIVAITRDARRSNPELPLIVVQTSLHNCYPRNDTPHKLPYPFTGTDEDFDIPGLTGDIRRALMAQRTQFSKVAGDGAVLFVPIDFTQPDQAIAPADYGVDRLLDAMEQVVPGVLARVKKIESLWFGEKAIDFIKEHILQRPAAHTMNMSKSSILFKNARELYKASKGQIT